MFQRRIRTRGALQTRASAAGFVPPVARATSQAEADDIARAARPESREHRPLRAMALS